MKERVSILFQLLPKYGEILLGIGSVLLASQKILDNAIAKDEVKQYLLKEAPRKINVQGISKCNEFQRIISKYTGKRINIFANKNYEHSGKIANILLVDFFRKSIWPILVSRYVDNLSIDIDKVTISINIKKNVYLTIYGEDNPELFFNEFKDFLLHNYIEIFEAVTKENGDILVKLILPVLPNTKFCF